MKEEQLMRPSVSPIDPSRFANIPMTPDPIVKTTPASSLTASSRTLPSRFAVALPEESMVVDDRSSLSPAQMVESKLMSRLRESSLPVSHLQMRGLVRARYEA